MYVALSFPWPKLMQLSLSIVFYQIAYRTLFDVITTVLMTNVDRSAMVHPKIRSAGTIGLPFLRIDNRRQGPFWRRRALLGTIKCPLSINPLEIFNTFT